MDKHAFKNELGGTSQVLSFSNKAWTSRSKESVEDLPIEFDWRKTGLLPKVRDQGHTSACWAFAVASAIEAGLRINRGLHVSVSRQELLDRCYNWRECGGWLHSGYKYVMRNGISLIYMRVYSDIYILGKSWEGILFALMVMRCDMDELSLMKVVLKHPTSVHFCAGRGGNDKWRGS